MSLLQNSNAISEGGYNIANSLRFQAASASYLSRTFGSAASGTTATFSFWMKRGSSAALQDIFGWSNGVNTSFTIEFQTNDQLSLYSYSGGMVGLLTTSQVFRDFSSWYHVVCVLDTTNATSTDRLRMYINGTRVTSFGTSIYPAQNTVLNLATTGHAWGIGIQAGTGAYSYDGYLSEFNFIDGQALTPSSFGETDTLTGQWVAKKYTGTYGTNGFYLPFSNGTSTTTLGYDSSGNSNNWTLNNFTRSAGTTDCWVNDVPSGNGSSVGGTQPNSNYAVGNPLNNSASGNITFTRGNLALAIGGVSAQWRSATATMSVSSGKWYWETTVTTSGGNGNSTVGIISDTVNIAGNYFPAGSTLGYSYLNDGNKYNNGAATAYGASWTTNDVIGIAFDADTGQLTFYKNGISQGVAYTVTSGNSYYPIFGGAGTTVSNYNLNFGQRSFAYTPPSGFKALCTANLPAATIKKGNTVFDATLYTGNGSTQTITNAAGFSPDIVWIKTRSMPYNNLLHDSVRGALNLLIPNGTDAEQSVADGITSFNSNGFTLGANGSYNQSTRTIVAWQWDAGSSTVTNTNGTISSQVRANPNAGVSVVTYTGNGTAGATIGHGLGVTPAMVIIKERSTTSAWSVWHKAFTFNEYIQLNTTGAKGTASGWFSANSNTFGFPTFYAGDLNDNGTTCVAYAFSEIAGFSKFGSYTGNGSTDGTFVYTGFRPKFVMIKQTNTSANWVIMDGARNPYNVVSESLQPNTSNAEESGFANEDFLSNGFKLRTTNATWNANGGTFIYMAFAENPFANANAR